MRPCEKVYYFKLYEIFDSYQPFQKYQMQDFLMNLYGYETAADLVAGVQLPSDFITNKSIYDELAALIWGRYYDEFFIKIRKWPNEDVTSDDIDNAVYHWGYKFVSKLNKKAQAKIEETNEEIEHTFKRVFDAVFSPEVQKHVVGAGIEMMLGFNAFLKAIPVPDKVQPYIDKVVEARENASAAYCAKNPDCPRKKAAAQSAKAKKIELD